MQGSDEDVMRQPGPGRRAGRAGGRAGETRCGDDEPR